MNVYEKINFVIFDILILKIFSDYFWSALYLKWVDPIFCYDLQLSAVMLLLYHVLILYLSIFLSVLSYMSVCLFICLSVNLCIKMMMMIMKRLRASFLLV